MKLLIAGVSLILLGIGLAVFTDLNPALLFIAGVIGTFLGVVNGVSAPNRGPAVSADPGGNAADLSNIQNYGSQGGDVSAIINDR